MKRTLLLLLLASVIALTGCTTNLTSKVSPGIIFNDLGKIYVVHFEPDKRHLNIIISDQLALMGYPATTGEESNIPEDVNTLVTYQDNWQWDITNYMIKISIQFRNGKNKELIVSGESYRTSLVRKSPKEMIQETLKEILKNKKR